MKKPLKIMVFVAILLSAGCVTTRAQYNEKNGITEDGETPVNTSNDGTNRSSSNVKSENITPAAPATTAVPTPTKSDAATESKSAPAADVKSTGNSPANSAPSSPMTAPTMASPSTAATTTPAPLSGVSVGTIAANGGAYSEDELKIELARVSGQVEEMQHDKQMSDQQHAEETKKYQDRIAELEKQMKLNQGAPAAAVPEGKSPFEAGKDAYLSGHYEDAISFMDQYLLADNVKSADEATYIRAESNFKQKNFKKAIVDFSKFPEKYQKSSFHPKALLGIAQSFDEMGMKDDAKAFYSELADKFPKTAEGKLAKKKLKKK